MRTKTDIFKIAYGRARIKGQVEGGGNINRIATRYTSLRKSGMRLPNALAVAVATKTGPEWYHGPSMGAPNEDGHRCVTAPSAYGLRFAGYSDEIIGGSHHEGWYTAHDGITGEVYRGCVFRLPGKDHMTRLLAGYRDMAGDCYIVDFSEVYTSIPLAKDDDGILYKAARDGDRMAQKDAEECRQHDYKWQKANEWADLCDQIGKHECECAAAATERDRMRKKIEEIEGEFLDIAEFAENNL